MKLLVRLVNGCFSLRVPGGQPPKYRGKPIRFDATALLTRGIIRNVKINPVFRFFRTTLERFGLTWMFSDLQNFTCPKPAAPHQRVGVVIAASCV